MIRTLRRDVVLAIGMLIGGALVGLTILAVTPWL